MKLKYFGLLLVWLAIGCRSEAPAKDAFLLDGGAADSVPGPVDGSPPASDRGAESSLPGPADGAPPDDAAACAPRPAVDSRSLFAQLVADLAGVSGAAARGARVDAFFSDVERSGGWPVRDATTVVFLYRGPVAGTATVAGTFNGWDAAADPLQPIADTDLRYLEKPLGGARHEYKLVVDGAWQRDPHSPHVVWDGIPRDGLGELNSVVPPFGAVQPAGRLEVLVVGSPQLGNTREVYVYLPPGYDADSCTRYPLLLINDGNESLTRAHLDEVAAATMLGGAAQRAVLAFVALAAQDQRLAEYSSELAAKGPAYASFLCDTLVPLLDGRYRTTARADERGVIGASMGGLSAFAALFWRNDCLRRAGAQSGSFWYADGELIARVKSTTPAVKLLHAYLDSGSDNRESTLQMRDALQARGYPVVHVENLQQAHEWSAWQDRFDEALAALLPP